MRSVSCPNNKMKKYMDSSKSCLKIGFSCIRFKVLFFLVLISCLYLKYSQQSLSVYAYDNTSSGYKVTYQGGFGDRSWTDYPLDYENYTIADQCEAGIFYSPYLSFAGWNTVADGTGISYLPGNTLKITQDISLYAQWTETYEDVGIRHVNYRGENDEFYFCDHIKVEEGDHLYQPISYEILTADTATGGEAISGRKFIAWQDRYNQLKFDEKQTVMFFEDVFPALEENLILNAAWEYTEYRIHYHPNEGMGTEHTEIIPLDTEHVILENNFFTKENSTFESWNTDPGGEGVRYYPGDVFDGENGTTLYAQWDENVYYVIYQGNGHEIGDAPIDTQKYMSGDIITVLGRNTMEKDGYIFKGWNTQADGMGIAYQPDDRFKAEGSIELYAQWILIEEQLYTVKFNSMGGSDISAIQDVPYGSLIAMPESPVRRGYVFEGWYSNRDRTRKWDFYKDKVIWNMTLYAGWVQEDESNTEETNILGKSHILTGDTNRLGILVMGVLIAGALFGILYFRKRK